MEMPLLEGFANGPAADEMEMTDEPESPVAVDPVEAVKEKVGETERMAVDAETIAETIPAAKKPAAEARKAADEVAGLMSEIEEAAMAMKEAEPGSGAADGAREKLDMVRAKLDEPCERAKAAYDEVMALMPQMSADGIDAWAEMTLGSGGE